MNAAEPGFPARQTDLAGVVRRVCASACGQAEVGCGEGQLGDQLRRALCRGQVLASKYAAPAIGEHISYVFDLWDHYDRAAQRSWLIAGGNDDAHPAGTVKSGRPARLNLLPPTVCRQQENRSKKETAI
jgi:hypothetical protein